MRELERQVTWPTSLGTIAGSRPGRPGVGFRDLGSTCRHGCSSDGVDLLPTPSGRCSTSAMR